MHAFVIHKVPLTLVLVLLYAASAVNCHSTSLQETRRLRRTAPLRSLTRRLSKLEQSPFHPAVNITPPHREAAASYPGKPCHPACTLRGNCNLQEGRCECPFGYNGPTCEEQLLPACRLVDKPGAIAQCFELGPVSCECHRQCLRLQCGLLNEGSGKCALQRYTEPACWEWPDRPPHLQLSAVPHEDDTSLRYYTRWQEMLHSSPKPAAVNRSSLPVLSRRGDEEHYVPEGRCPGGCSDRGRCIVYKGLSEPQCRCYMGYHGAACELQHSDPRHIQSCINNCNGRGTCSYGFCHCQPGWWGLDCSSRRPYTSSSSTLPARHRARIYVYELPSWLSHRPFYEFCDIYKADLEMLKILLGDWSVRTANPWEANLFYIPAFTTFYGGHVGWMQGAQGHVDHVVQWLKAAHPFWNRTQGRDHFYWATNDWGVCKYPNSSSDLANPIRVVHFGYHVTGRQHDPWLKHTWDCFDVHKDVVAAPLDTMNPPKPGHQWPADLEQYVRSKSKLLMYSGWVPTDYVGWMPGGKMPDSYSFMARQTLWAHFQNHSDPAVVISSQLGASYIPTLQDSLYCISPVGFGWAIRTVAAATYGCIPVTLQDGMYQPWYDLLPYHEFSLRFSVEDIPQMAASLRQIPYPEVLRMYRSLRRHRRAFLWQRELGGRAFEYMVASLMERRHRLWGLIY